MNYRTFFSVKRSVARIQIKYFIAFEHSFLLISVVNRTMDTALSSLSFQEKPKTHQSKSVDYKTIADSSSEVSFSKALSNRGFQYSQRTTNESNKWTIKSIPKCFTEFSMKFSKLHFNPNKKLFSASKITISLQKKRRKIPNALQLVVIKCKQHIFQNFAFDCVHQVLFDCCKMF